MPAPWSGRPARPLYLTAGTYRVCRILRFALPDPLLPLCSRAMTGGKNPDAVLMIADSAGGSVDPAYDAHCLPIKHWAMAFLGRLAAGAGASAFL